jgi:hypothetical protein
MLPLQHNNIILVRIASGNVEAIGYSIDNLCLTTYDFLQLKLQTRLLVMLLLSNSVVGNIGHM